MAQAYADGRNDALANLRTTAAIRRRLAGGGEYWDGWHAARPEALDSLGREILEDPTRGGGWCCRPVGA